MIPAKSQLSLFALFISSLQFTVNGGPSHAMKHFVLVHGACHGAWSWYKLVPLLRSSGHNVTVLDMAASGVYPRQQKDLRSISDYHQPLIDLMASLPHHERVVLVGHSFGGLGLAQVMEAFPHKISASVFVTAFMPGPSFKVSTLNQKLLSTNAPKLDTEYTYGDGPNNPPTTMKFGPVILLSKFYQLSPVEDWTLATTLMRPVRLLSEDDMSRELVVTREKYGSVKRIFIVAEKDLAIPKDFQEYMIKEAPPHETEEISGSDHMVMLSKPKELCARLLRIAQKYN